MKLLGPLFVACLGTSVLHAQSDAITVTRTLPQLVEQSQIIVHAHVVSVRIEPHASLRNVPTLVLTLRPIRVLKGKAGSLLTIRQFMWSPSDQRQLAGYSKGQEVLLLINPASRFGLTSTAGLTQGRFHVYRNRQGEAFAVNGHGNRGLLRDVSSVLDKKGITLPAELVASTRKEQPGPISLEHLQTMIDLLGAKR